MSSSQSCKLFSVVSEKEEKRKTVICTRALKWHNQSFGTALFIIELSNRSIMSFNIPVIYPYPKPGGLPGSSCDKESAYHAGDLGLIPGSRRSLEEGNGNPLQYSCLENPMDRGAWWGIALLGHKELDTTEELTRSCIHPKPCYGHYRLQYS